MRLDICHLTPPLLSACQSDVFACTLLVNTYLIYLIEWKSNRVKEKQKFPARNKAVEGPKCSPQAQASGSRIDRIILCG